MGKRNFDSDKLQSKVAKPYAGNVTPVEAWEKLQSDKDSVLIDVRTIAEWMFVGNVDMSSVNKTPIFVSWRVFPEMNINDNFVQQVLAQKNIDKETNIFFLCKIGGRSAEAAAKMTQEGFVNCYNILGGFEGDLDENNHRGTINGWKINNLPWEQR